MFVEPLCSDDNPVDRKIDPEFEDAASPDEILSDPDEEEEEEEMKIFPDIRAPSPDETFTSPAFEPGRIVICDVDVESLLKPVEITTSFDSPSNELPDSISTLPNEDK